MELLLFTKIFAGCGIDEVGAAAVELGFDGLDLAVRQGQCIEPSEVVRRLPEALRVWRAKGLSVPMLTMEGDFTDPEAPGVEAIYRVCRDCGIPLVKLGYWRRRVGDNYWKVVEDIRTSLAGFAELGEKYGVCSLVHTHAGGHYGGNVASARQLVEGFDPEFVGLYIDPAHQALEGEPAGIALGIADTYLRMVGIKNVRYVAKPAIERTAWQSEWCLLNEGLVDWPQALSEIVKSGYSAPLSFHAIYSDHRDREGAMSQTRKDLQYLRPLLAALEAVAPTDKQETGWLKNMGKG